MQTLYPILLVVPNLSSILTMLITGQYRLDITKCHNSLLLNNSNITFVKTLQKDFDNAKVHDRSLKQSEMVEYLEIFDKNSIL